MGPSTIKLKFLAIFVVILAIQCSFTIADEEGGELYVFK